MSIEKISSLTSGVNIAEIEGQQEGHSKISFPSFNFDQIKDNYDRNNKVYAEKLVKTVSPVKATGAKNFEPGSLNFPSHKYQAGSAETKLPLIDTGTIEKIKPKNIKGVATSFTEKIKSMDSKKETAESPALEAFLTRNLGKNGFLLTALIKLSKKEPLTLPELVSVQSYLPEQETSKIENLLKKKSSLSSEFAVLVAGTLQAIRNMSDKLGNSQRTSPFTNTMLQLGKKFSELLESGDKASIMIFAAFMLKLSDNIKKPSPDISGEVEKLGSLLKNLNDKELKDYVGTDVFDFIKSYLTEQGLLKDSTAVPEKGRSSLPLISKTLETPVSSALKNSPAIKTAGPEVQTAAIARNISGNDIKTTFITSAVISEAFEQFTFFSLKLTGFAGHYNHVSGDITPELAKINYSIAAKPLFDREQLANTLTSQMLRQISNELIASADLEEAMLKLGFNTTGGENDPALLLILRFKEILNELSGKLNELIASELSKKLLDESFMNKKNDFQARLKGLEQSWETIKNEDLVLLDF